MRFSFSFENEVLKKNTTERIISYIREKNHRLSTIIFIT